VLSNHCSSEGPAEPVSTAKPKTELQEKLGILKLINRLRTTHWTPPEYWQTDNFNGLVMVIRNYHWLNSACRVLISTCSTPLVQTGKRKQF